MIPSSTPRRAVVLCADDFALSESASLAIAELASDGRLGAVSAMTAGAGWPRAWSLLPQMPDRVSVGLHVNLVEGGALSDGKPFPSAATLAALEFSGRLRRDALAAEIDAQWTAFEDHAGRGPDFVDTHQHVHLLTTVREALLEVIAKRGGRVPVRSLWPAVGPRDSFAKRMAFRLLGSKALARRLDLLGLAANRTFGGLQAFDAPQAVPRDWAELLCALPDNALVACHPARAAEPGDPIGPFRLAEFRWLGSQDFAAASREAGIDWVDGPRARPASVTGVSAHLA